MSHKRRIDKKWQKRWVWTVAFVLWLCVVWGHSLLPGDVSSAESSRSLFLVRPLFSLFGNADEELMTFVVRKTAHFLEYAILMAIGRTMVLAWVQSQRRARWLTLLLLVLVPCADETLQLMTPGRSALVTDVLLDMAGGSVGFVVRELVCTRVRNRSA